MTDIVTRLRATCDRSGCYPGDPCNRCLQEWEAADEIEALREALHESGDGDTWRDACHRMEYELEWRNTELSTLRGLLREVLEQWSGCASMIDPQSWHEWGMPQLYQEAQAAMEGQS